MLVDTITLYNNLKPENPYVVTHKGVVIDFNCSQAFLFGEDMDKFKRRIGPLCACGCGEKANWGKWRKGHWNKGRSLSDEHKRKISKAKMGNTNMLGKNFPRKQNKEYQSAIKTKSFLKNPDEKCHLHLTIHHIDYIKKNCHPWNLITLCTSCNTRANSNRKHQSKFYQNIMTEQYGYNYASY